MQSIIVIIVINCTGLYILLGKPTLFNIVLLYVVRWYTIILYIPRGTIYSVSILGTTLTHIENKNRYQNPFDKIPVYPTP